MRAIFIDDDRLLLETWETIFENRDVSHLIAFVHSTNVEEALNAIRRHNPEVIFLDHELTHRGNEGLEIVDRLKRNGDAVRIVSSTSRQDVFESYKALGVEEHVEKRDNKKMLEIILGKA